MRQRAGKIIEYRVCMGETDGNGDCTYANEYEGKDWRYIHKLIKELEAGLHNTKDSDGEWIIWIERVENWYDETIPATGWRDFQGDRDIEIIWERVE